MSIATKKRTTFIAAAVVAGLCSIVCVAWFATHLYWQSWLHEHGKRDVVEFVEMLFEPGKQAVRVDVGSVEPFEWFGMGVHHLEVTALTPDFSVLKIGSIQLSPTGIPDGRSYRFRANDIGEKGSLFGTAEFERYDLERDSRAKLKTLDAKLVDIDMQTLTPILRHFTDDTALTTLMSWLSGRFGGSISHQIDRGTVRLVADDLNMRKLHEMLPSISVDEFDLGVDYSPGEIVFSKASAIRLPNAEFQFRGGLRRAQADNRVWDLAIDLKTIPILHIVAAPIFGCPKQQISWQTFAGRPSTKTYQVSGELLSPKCHVVL